MESHSRFGMSDLQHGSPGVPASAAGRAGNLAAGADPHTILHAKTPQAAKQIRQLTTSLRDCNRAVGNADALLKELQDVTGDQDDEIRRLKSQLGRSEEKRRRAASSHGVHFSNQPSTSGPPSTIRDSAGMESLSGMLSQSLHQQDELRRELQQQGHVLKSWNQDRSAHQPASLPSVTYPLAVPTAAMSTSQVGDHRQQDQFNSLSQSVAQINQHLTSRRHQDEAVSAARLHDRVDTLRTDVHRMEQSGGGQPAAHAQLSTLQQQMQSLETRQQQALSEITRNLGELQHRPTQQDTLLREVSHLRDDIKSNQSSSTSTDRLAGRLDTLDMTVRQQQAGKDVLLQRLDQLERHFTSQEDRRSTTFGHVRSLQEQLADMERAQSRLNLQLEGLRGERGSSSLRETERQNTDLLSRLQQSVTTADRLRASNEQLQNELRRLAMSQSTLSDSQRAREKAVQISQKYKVRFQGEQEQRLALQKQVEAVTRTLQALESRHQSDHVSLRQQAIDQKNLQTRLEHMELEREQLQAELATANVRYSTTEEDRTDAQKEVERLQTEYRDATRHYQSQQARANGLCEKLSAKLSKLKDREKELQLLAKSSSHREGLIREEAERLKKAASELQARHQQQLTALQEQLRQQRGSAEQRIQEMSQHQQQQVEELTALLDRQKAELVDQHGHAEAITSKQQVEMGNRIRLQQQCAKLEQALRACKEKMIQQREAYRGKVAQLKAKGVTADGLSVDDMATQLNASRHLSEQILQDQETILRAVASEVDGLINQVTEQSSLPKPILPDTSGLETDARKWISAILGKLTWLQRELRLKEEREKHRKPTSS